MEPNFPWDIYYQCKGIQFWKEVKDKMEYGYLLNPIVMEKTHYEKFEEYMKQYEGASERQLMSEIMRVRGEVSSEVVNTHIRNLELMGQMEGFADAQIQQRIAMMKNMLTANAAASSGTVETAQWGGSGLLLWFLLLSSIWRRPGFGRPGFGRPGFGRPGFGRPGFGYPGYGYPYF